MRALACIAMALLTAACASPQQVALPPADKPLVYIPPSLTASCPGLPLADAGSLDVLLKNHIETARDYALCARGKDSLVQYLRTQRGVKVQ